MKKKHDYYIDTQSALYWLFIGIIGLLILLNAGCPFRSSGKSEYTGSYSTKHSARTNGGTQVYSKEKIDTSLLPLIYQGLYTLAYTTELEGYQPMDMSEFIVALFATDKRCQNPGFVIRADGSPWDGTEYDKDPRPGKVLICAAGLHPGSNVMVVAAARSHMHIITQFEGEHIVLLNRDLERWQATMGVHAHPIFRQSPDGVVETEKAEKPFEFEATTITLAGDIESDGVSLKAGETVCILLTK